MPVIHMELVAFLASASIINTCNKRFPVGEWLLRGLTVFGSAAKSNPAQVRALEAKRGLMDVETAQEEAETLVDYSSAPLSEVLPASTARGFDTLTTLTFSLITTAAVTGLSALYSCVRGTEQHSMSFIALCVCAATAMYVLVVRATASSGQSTAAQRSQSTLRQVGIAAGAVGVVLALLAMMAPDRVFDFSLRRGLNEAARHATSFVAVVLGDSASASEQQEPWLAFTFFAIALVCGAVTFIQVMPAILYARSVALQLNDASVPQWQRMLSLGAFAAPLLLAALWVRPVLGDSVLPPDLVKCNAAALARDCTTLPHAGEFFLTETQWFSLRVAAVLALCVAQVPVIRWLVAAHLRRARNDQVRTLVEFVSVPKESLRADLDIMAELTSLAAEPFQSVNVVTSSLLAPFVLLAMLALAAVRKGELSPLYTCPAVHASMAAVGLPAGALAVAAEDQSRLSDLDAFLMDTLSIAFPELPSTREMHLISPSLWRPLLSILIWYFLASWFVLSALALAYWQLEQSSAKLKLDERTAPAARAAAANAKAAEAKAAKKSRKAKKALKKAAKADKEE
ncbi:hypothetical protein FNF29_01347 [Cafeteria roenbergensis]|uniref:Uncharacterized protein n=1 Tax=Cafeteria roenbergensis TaxID=33653 RepID=A0A5A8CT49_CAFRO|nr:hypothetical protein FNF29_01347 [Cafeteria roenbergensis]|eukprot:KAA0155928.1 hypothetical protein FNF29_01347 [Cafeteria roenbergensis]